MIRTLVGTEERGTIDITSRALLYTGSGWPFLRNECESVPRPTPAVGRPLRLRRNLARLSERVGGSTSQPADCLCCRVVLVAALPWKFIRQSPDYP